MPGTFPLKRLFPLLSLALLAVSPSGLSAQRALSLDDCVQMALRSNKDIEAAQHLQRKYEHERRALRANFFPIIEASATDVYSTFEKSRTVDLASPVGQYIGQRLHTRLPWLIGPAWQQRIASGVTSKLLPLNPVIDMKMGNIFMADVTLTQPLYMGGKISAGYHIGTLGARMAALGQELTREQTIVSVHEAYLLLVKAKELHVVALKYDSLLQKLTDDVASARSHGMVSNNEVMKVRVKKSEAELKVTQASNGIRLARMNLCQVIGLPTDALIDVRPDDIGDADFTADPCATIEGRTETQLLDLKTELARQQVKLERSAMLPQLGLIAGARVLDGIKLAGEKFLSHNLMFDVGVSLKIPIFNGGQHYNKMQAAKEELERSRLERESLSEKMNLELQQQANEAEEAGLEVKMRRRSLEQCAENLRMSRKAYSVGYETLSELLTAQLLWQQAYAELVEAKYQQNIKIVKWQKAAGRLGLYY